MKKIRIMLLAIAVISIAGGTLAFKAKFQDTICTDVATTFPSGPNQGKYTCFIQNVFTATCDAIRIACIETVTDPLGPQLCYTFAEYGNCPEVSVTGRDCMLATTTTCDEK